jgi:hypothetical protein
MGRRRIARDSGGSEAALWSFKRRAANADSWAARSEPHYGNPENSPPTRPFMILA